MPLIELQSVSKSYGALKVTDAISLSVAEGETLGILGPNGAGKTTLFNLISGDVRCDAGRVLQRLGPTALESFEKSLQQRRRCGSAGGVGDGRQQTTDLGIVVPRADHAGQRLQQR